MRYAGEKRRIPTYVGTKRRKVETPKRRNGWAGDRGAGDECDPPSGDPHQFPMSVPLAISDENGSSLG
jgi:hypothetical protein